jgi:hypothetical protein
MRSLSVSRCFGLIALGIGLAIALPAGQARSQVCPTGPHWQTCGSTDEVLEDASADALDPGSWGDGDQGICRAACRRVLQACRAGIRRVLACQNARGRELLADNFVVCRRENDAKAIHECRNRLREIVASNRNDRDDFRSAFSACEEAVGTCRCGT